MNCEDYRHRIAAEPTFDGGADHVSGCQACQRFRDEIRLLDGRINSALQISVPTPKLPELPEIESENVVPISTRKRRTTPVWYAMAATVVLAAVIGIRMTGVGVSYDSLADEVLAHLDHEPASLRPTTTPVSDVRLAKVVPADVARMDHDAGLITYARSCEINGKSVPHLVIQGERGPITILLMPDEPVAEAVTLEDDNVHGVILPVGQGSIAIIGARDEKLERVERSVLNSVTWST